MYNECKKLHHISGITLSVILSVCLLCGCAKKSGGPLTPHRAFASCLLETCSEPPLWFFARFFYSMLQTERCMTEIREVRLKPEATLQRTNDSRYAGYRPTTNCSTRCETGDRVFQARLQRRMAKLSGPLIAAP
jgi:hypothetical protein